MIAETVLTLVAAVVAVQDAGLYIDKGSAQGLRHGDRGEVFYELTVNDEAKRIGVGEVEVFSVEVSEALARPLRGVSVRPGFKVAFEIDQERLSARSKIALEEPQAPEAAAFPVAGPVAPSLARPPVVEAPVVEPAAEPPAVSTAIGPTLVWIDAGNYAIGVDTANGAKFYNESPRFRTTVAGFWIEPVPSATTGVDFAQAQSHCEARGGRLPTEFEWEVAARHPSFETLGHLEWTSSWYLPYPGNRRPEEEYGKRFRVLRGSTEAKPLRPERRGYLEPGTFSSNVGFRCASSDASSTSFGSD